jgi:hypothetical protein
MLEKIVGIKIELKPKIPKENEKLCDTCGGVGWLYDKEYGYISMCTECYGGIIHLCPKCQQPKRGMCMNKECRALYDAEEEQKHLAKAIKAKYEDVPAEKRGMLYSRVYPYNEGYFSNIEDLEEYCQDNDVPVPSYVWSTKKFVLSMDAGSIIENACEELHENAMDNIEGEKELQEFLNAWCANQSGTDTYTVDYKYAIEVN